MRTYVLPYKMGSKSAKALAVSLSARRLRRIGTYLPRSEDFIVNWGLGTTPPCLSQPRAVQRLGGVRIINHPERVAIASSKLATFRALESAGVAIPEFTTDRITASDWPHVFVRHLTRGHSGAGIEFVGNGTQLPHAPLYVKSITNNGEYRVHVVNGQVIDYTKKRRQRGDRATNEQLKVRNLANGWIYTREHLNRLERVEQIAVRAVQALGLDFGAVDIIKDENGDVFVLEVNTACGMSETTLANYTQALISLRDNS